MTPRAVPTVTLEAAGLRSKPRTKRRAPRYALDRSAAKVDVRVGERSENGPAPKQNSEAGGPSPRLRVWEGCFSILVGVTQSAKRTRELGPSAGGTVSAPPTDKLATSSSYAS